MVFRETGDDSRETGGDSRETGGDSRETGGDSRGTVTTSLSTVTTSLSTVTTSLSTVTTSLSTRPCTPVHARARPGHHRASPGITGHTDASLSGESGFARLKRHLCHHTEGPPQAPLQPSDFGTGSDPYPRQAMMPVGVEQTSKR